MLDLAFAIAGVEHERASIVPQILFKAQVLSKDDSVRIHSIALRCQVRIEPARRRYSGSEPEKLLDLFDSPDRWGKTMRDMLWTHVSTVVPDFTGELSFNLSVPCSTDFAMAATKYFGALDDGEIPLSFLFSGTVFYEGPHGLQVGQIPWDKDARYRMPVATWKQVMDLHYPNSAWLQLRRDVFDQLQQFKSHRGLPTWEAALTGLLATAKEPVRV